MAVILYKTYVLLVYFFSTRGKIEYILQSRHSSLPTTSFFVYPLLFCLSPYCKQLWYHIRFYKLLVLVMIEPIPLTFGIISLILAIEYFLHILHFLINHLTPFYTCQLFFLYSNLSQKTMYDILSISCSALRLT
jgi:hypothetical protein